VKFLRRYQEEIFAVGIGVMLIGAVVAAWFGSSFESLFNYQRLATLIPLCFGAVLVSINAFLDWDQTPGYLKGKAVGVAIAFALLVAGTIAWWAFDPTARG